MCPGNPSPDIACSKKTPRSLSKKFTFRSLIPDNLVDALGRLATFSVPHAFVLTKTAGQPPHNHADVGWLEGPTFRVIAVCYPSFLSFISFLMCLTLLYIIYTWRLLYSIETYPKLSVRVELRVE
jgi:hypothetical protein